jgi:nitrate reductase cytochrome c-type subunit
MKMLLRCVTVASLAVVLALPLIACADERENYEADAKYAEDAPPVIPHPIADNITGEGCLACHRTGLNGAPPSPHPIRLNCTQCHVRSDLGEPKKTKKSKKEKKD